MTQHMQELGSRPAGRHPQQKVEDTIVKIMKEAANT